jgi:hypothetical protein
VTTTFTTSLRADPTPQLALVLRALEDVIHAVTEELTGLVKKDKAKRAALINSEKDRLKECKQMALFAMYGKARDTRINRYDWDEETRKLATKTKLQDFHEDFQVSRPVVTRAGRGLTSQIVASQALYGKPMKIFVGLKGIDQRFINTYYFRKLMLQRWKVRGGQVESLTRLIEIEGRGPYTKMIAVAECGAAVHRKAWMSTGLVSCRAWLSKTPSGSTPTPDTSACWPTHSLKRTTSSSSWRRT